MEEKFAYKPYVISDKFFDSRSDVYYFGLQRFGVLQAEKYDQKIEKAIEALPEYYTYHSECRHLRTKSRKYRNIILDAHLIVYRITDVRIEVLDIVHKASSISKIRNVRKIRF